MYDQIKKHFLESSEGDLVVEQAALEALWRSLKKEEIPEDKAETIRILKATGVAFKQHVEDCLRKLLQEVCTQSDTKLIDNAVAKLLDMATWLADKSILEPGLPCTLLEDLVDISASHSDYDELLKWLEEHRDILKQVHIFSRGKLILLRTCNKALKQLAGGPHSGLCGRIFLLMGHLWPLVERSAVNHVGSFDTHHPIQMELTPKGPLMKDMNGLPIDRDMYVRLWGLVSEFKNPSFLTSKLGGLLKDLNAVVDKLSKEELNFKSTMSGLGVGAKLALQHISRPPLFRLQLKDAAFHVHFLLEALVFLHRIECPPKAGPTVSDEELADVKKAKQKVAACLSDCGDDGAEICEVIKMQLQQETGWVEWKNDSCKDWTLARPQSKPQEQHMQSGLELDPEVRNGAGKQDRERLLKVDEKYLMGKGGIVATSFEIANEEFRVPTGKEFTRQLVTEMESQEQGDVPDNLSAARNVSYCWRTYRILTTESWFGADTAAPLDIKKFIKNAFPEVKVEVKTEDAMDAVPTNGNAGVNELEENGSGSASPVSKKLGKRSRDAETEENEETERKPKVKKE